MTALALVLTLSLHAQMITEAHLGEPLTVDYQVPGDLQPLPLDDTSEEFALLSQDGGSVTVVPLVLDTLNLPDMDAVSADSSISSFQAPLVVVSRTMPDTTWNVPVFTSPLNMRIPPGYPADYLQRHMFWKKWGKAPSRLLLILLGIALVLILAGLGYWLYRRRHSSVDAITDAGSHEKLSPVDEVRALLESNAFVQGDWQAYYKEIDRLLRNTVAHRFGITNRALTWGQISLKLRGESAGRRFQEDAREITREITLQRYAGWGGSRDRARRFTEKLASLRKEWHRK